MYSILRVVRHAYRSLLLCSVIFLSLPLATYAGSQAVDIANEILHVTKQATLKIEALEKARVPPEQIFERVKEITESHVRTIAALGSRFDALPAELRQNFIESYQAKQLTEATNNELARMKKLATRLVDGATPKSTVHAPLYFGQRPTHEVSKLLEGKWPTESRKSIEAKYGFLRVFILSMQNVKKSDRTTAIGSLENLRSKALQGDSVATARLNGLLKEVLEIYPKDDARAQYNLGVLYADTGDPEQARKWLEKSSSQGLHAADVELRKLQDR